MSDIQLTVQAPAPPNLQITPLTTASVEVSTAGPQGPPGLQNVFIGPNPPTNPTVNMIWIQTFE